MEGAFKFFYAFDLHVLYFIIFHICTRSYFPLMSERLCTEHDLARLCFAEN